MLTILLVLIAYYVLQIDCVLQEFRRVEMHHKCRCSFYPGTLNSVHRMCLADNEIKWSKEVHKPPYNPPSYTAPVVSDGPIWADRDMHEFWPDKKPRWNVHDGQSYNRICGSHLYAVNDSIPVNPVGRTGLQGRGLLGRWGPNHAVTLVLARYSREPPMNGVRTDLNTSKPMLEVLAVMRQDVKQWALPSTFVKKGERIAPALTRCIVSECLNNLKMYSDESQKRSIMRRFVLFFSHTHLLYRGYIDDPRNTDNSWVSSTVMLAFDDTNVTHSVIFQPGGRSNIVNVKWISADKIPELLLYANHQDFVNDTAILTNTFYPKPVKPFVSSVLTTRRRV